MDLYIRIGITIATIVLMASAFYITSTLIVSKKLHEGYSRMTQQTKRALYKTLKKSKFKAFDYEYLDGFLKENGVYTMFKKLDPLLYIGIKAGVSIFLLIVLVSVSPIAGVVGMILGFIVPDYIFKESNNSDNKKMMDDIKNIYDTLRIQTKAGVYITSVLTDCYLVVQNKRLKKALLELTSDIIAKNDINEALDDFASKFTNEYITTLATIIKQSLQTGQASKLFEDIKEQINDIEAALILREKERINSQVVAVQALIYVSIIIVSIFVCMLALQAGLDF